MILRIKKWLRDLLFPSEDGVAMTETAREEWLNAIKRHGYTAYYWLPGISHQDDRELWDAIEGLKRAGFIVTRPDGALAGKVAAARLSTDEKAEQRRATFRLVD